MKSVHWAYLPATKCSHAPIILHFGSLKYIVYQICLLFIVSIPDSITISCNGFYDRSASNSHKFILCISRIIPDDKRISFSSYTVLWFSVFDIHSSLVNIFRNADKLDSFRYVFFAHCIADSTFAIVNSISLMVIDWFRCWLVFINFFF